MKNRLILAVMMVLMISFSCSESEPGISEEEVMKTVIEDFEANAVVLDSAFAELESFLKTKDLGPMSDTYGSAASFAQSFDDELERIFNDASQSAIELDGEISPADFFSSKLYLHAAKGNHIANFPKYRLELESILDADPDETITLLTSCDCGATQSETLNMNFDQITYGQVKKHILPFFELLMDGATDSEIENRIEQVIETDDGRYLEPAIRLALAGVNRVENHPAGVQALLMDGSVRSIRGGSFLATVEYIMSDEYESSTVQRSSVRSLKVTFNSAARISLMDAWNHYN